MLNLLSLNYYCVLFQVAEEVAQQFVALTNPSSNYSLSGLVNKLKNGS